MISDDMTRPDSPPDVTPAVDDDAVRAVLRSLFPRALAENPLDRGAQISFGHAFTAGLVSALRAAAPGAPEELALACSTWGDVFDWFGDALVRSGGRPFGRRNETRGARVSLRPVRANDLGDLYEAVCHPAAGYRWRYRGQTPSFDEFQAGLFSSVLCQYMVAETSSERPVGLVTAYNSDLGARRTYFAFLALPGRQNSSRLSMIEGAALFISYLYRTFPFERVLFELPSYNWSLVEDLVTSGIADKVAELPDYYFHDERWYSHLICQISKPSWQRVEAWFSTEPTTVATE